MADDETDYLIIGAGAVGLACADTLLDEDPDCHITFVDRHAKPGGHGNDAYFFVALHQPSAFYGVNSMAFPGEQIDTHGPNQGLYALASGTEVPAYFEKVMNLRLLPFGPGRLSPAERIQGPRCRRHGADRRGVVGRGASHDRAPQAGRCDLLPDLGPQHPQARLLGRQGRAGGRSRRMDVGVWRLEAGVAPERIHRVRPRDSWLTNRKYVQPGENFLGATIANQIAPPAPLTDTPATFPYALMMNLMNRSTWSQTSEIAAWLARSRLDPTGPTIARMMAAGDPRLAALGGFREAVMQAMPHVIRLGMAAKALREGASPPVN